ncbi:aromatic ring-hydroxylating dioxygenase subunit alpha [Methylocella tundrae]|uniref:Rieske domain-containing protein n=1 Tax=Methylocella tundrae TaxID=227605 RepID=A0A4V6INB2_METTU|nr:aromatic ring-hydroxylating dioxygenase subunit alpha [Methylocella tundrae]WPP02931.1 aromatic ring-hydroxylating dioxygenase subunit alpha [Methylocella tundrae]VFU16590.1 conserved protein of unknown function [Methylocella tundrae]
MNYLRNAWYVAAAAAEVVREPFRRIILEEPIVLYRLESGEPAALFDRCPHRFAPLSRGRQIGDDLQCIYHGLRFDKAGVCVLNPHGSKSIPQTARVKSYPLYEKYGYVWIWPGDPARADPSLIPEFDFLEDKKSFRTVSGYLTIDANYQLVVDNLLDLSHVEFLHPMFARKEGVDSHRTEFSQEGNAIYSRRLKSNSSLNDFARLFWTSPSEKGDGRANMRWTPPSLLYFDLGVTEVGAPVAEGVCTPAAHLLTPETPYRTHYFWSQGRNRKLDDEKLDEILHNSVHRVFTYEDKPIIEAQQEEMGEQTDLIAMRPVLLEPDIPGIRARRVLGQLIDEEEQASATPRKSA